MRTRCSQKVVVFLAAMLLPLTLSAGALGQESQEEQEDAQRRVRVPNQHANVHMGPSSGRPVLVLVPKDTVLPVTGTQGEWLEVELSPELRKTGMVMRWYENEDRGWMHESTVELVEEEEPR